MQYKITSNIINIGQTLHIVVSRVLKRFISQTSYRTKTPFAFRYIAEHQLTNIIYFYATKLTFDKLRNLTCFIHNDLRNKVSKKTGFVTHTLNKQLLRQLHRFIIYRHTVYTC